VKPNLLRPRWPKRPAEIVGQIGADDEAIRQNLMQTCPFLLDVPCRLAIQQIAHLTRVVFDVVELVLEPGAVEAEVNRISPIALADRPNMAAGSAGRKKEAVVEVLAAKARRSERRRSATTWPFCPRETNLAAPRWAIRRLRVLVGC
jgi:hypothetical protein